MTTGAGARRLASRLSITSVETRTMYRFIIALAVLIGSTAASLAQDVLPSPSLWRSDRGAILKVLRIDRATGAFSGVFISSPTGACPAVPYDLAGRVRIPQRRVVFTTSRTWTSDCGGTVAWSGRAIGRGAAAVTWRTRVVGPNGRVTTRRGTDVFRRM
jgi:hypothetical protein